MSLEEFVFKYEGYVGKWADHYIRLFYDSNLEKEDLVQVGYLGLIEAYYNYDSSKSSISTYAFLRVRFKILNYIKKSSCCVNVPNNLVEVFSKVNKKKSDFYKINGRNMTDEETLEYITSECYTSNYVVDLDFVKKINQIESLYLDRCKISMNVTSSYHLDGSNLEDESFIVRDSIASDFNLSETAVDSVMVYQIISFISENFSEMDLEIFKEKFGLVDGVPKIDKVIAEKFNVSHQAINQRYNKVLKKVKDKFSNLE